MLTCGYCGGAASIGAASLLNNIPICYKCNGSASGNIDESYVRNRQRIIENQLHDARLKRAMLAKRGITGVITYTRDDV